MAAAGAAALSTHIHVANSHDSTFIEIADNIEINLNVKIPGVKGALTNYSNLSRTWEL